jgi:hypothetical protein
MVTNIFKTSCDSLVVALSHSIREVVGSNVRRNLGSDCVFYLRTRCSEARITDVSDMTLKTEVPCRIGPVWHVKDP